MQQKLHVYIYNMELNCACMMLLYNNGLNVRLQLCNGLLLQAVSRLGATCVSYKAQICTDELGPKMAANSKTKATLLLNCKHMHVNKNRIKVTT